MHSLLKYIWASLVLILLQDDSLVRTLFLELWCFLVFVWIRSFHYDAGGIWTWTHSLTSNLVIKISPEERAVSCPQNTKQLAISLVRTCIVCLNPSWKFVFDLVSPYNIESQRLSKIWLHASFAISIVLPLQKKDPGHVMFPILKIFFFYKSFIWYTYTYNTQYVTNSCYCIQRNPCSDTMLKSAHLFLKVPVFSIRLSKFKHTQMDFGVQISKKRRKDGKKVDLGETI